VQDNAVQFTNNGFSVHGDQLAWKFRIRRVLLINDFVANGYGLLTLKTDALIEVQKGECVSGAPMACLGAGTGLGEVYLTSATDGRYSVWASEGGHVEFAARTPLETELLAHLQSALRGRVSVERIVSGIGLSNIYKFLRVRFASRVEPAYDNRIMLADEPSMTIVQLVHDYALCKEAVELMLSAYGSETGNMALKCVL